MSMTPDELKNHLQSHMRAKTVAQHLTEEHGVETTPTKLQDQIAMHRKVHVPDMQESPAGGNVLAGVMAKPEDVAAARPKPRAPRAPRKVEEVAPVVDLAAKRTARKPRASKPETPVQTAKRTARTAVTRTPKPAPAKPVSQRTAKAAPAKAATASTSSRGRKPAPAPELNGQSPRELNQELARRLIDSIAKEFADASKVDQQKIANWLHPLPTGGAGWERYWPTGFPRPTSAGWRKPEGAK